MSSSTPSTRSCKRCGGKILDTLTALLADDFLITTAGWIAEPADKSTWLAGLAEHQLDEFELRLLAVRQHDNVAVVLAESAQKGSRSGEQWELFGTQTCGDAEVRDGSWLSVTRRSSAPHNHARLAPSCVAPTLTPGRAARSKPRMSRAFPRPSHAMEVQRMR